MKFLFNPIGTYGDVHPYLGVGCVLKERGHHVVVIANDYFSTLIQGLGLDFRSCGTVAEQEAYWRHPNMWNPVKSWSLSLRNCALQPMRRVYDVAAEEYVPGQTVAAGPGWSFGIRIAHDKLGIPLATMHLEPYWIRSLFRTSIMPPPLVMADWVPRISKRIQFWLADRLVIDRVLAAPTNAFRAELGLRPVQRLMHAWWHSPQRVIGLFPDWFFPPQPDWPDQTRLTGFPLWDRSDGPGLPAAVSRFLEEGEPPIVFAPGSENSQAQHFFRCAVDACETLGRRGILLTHHVQQLPARLPATVAHFSYVPFSQLLPRVAAIVHSALTGTAAQALRAGIPQVVVPLAYDQPDTADCLVRLGVARCVQRKRLTSRILARELTAALTSATIANHCQQVATRMHADRPLEQISNLLESLDGSERNAPLRHVCLPAESAAVPLDQPTC